VAAPRVSRAPRPIPGGGKARAVVPLDEIHAVRRFPAVGPFLSYARLVRCSHESAGKRQGTGGNKIGNAHLQGAFSEAAGLFLRESDQAKQWLAPPEKKHGQAPALGAPAPRHGRD